MMIDVLDFTAIRLSQPIGDLYVARLPAERLLQLAKANIRRITNREDETRTGIQRDRTKRRIDRITQYIGTIDASFPNAIILNLNSKYLVGSPYDLEENCGDETDIFCFKVKLNEEAFSIIDGQHRLYGFENATIEYFDLIVTFFVDLPVEDQAYLFSTINGTQAPVSKSLVYDLFDVSETRSPQRTAHLITKALNSDKDSPLYRRIKLLGSAPKFEGEVLYSAPLSQGTVATRIVELISADPMSDRDQYRRGRDISFQNEGAGGSLIFRRFFIDDRDWAILKVLKSYFQAISEVFPELWASSDNPLSKTIGYGALMKLLVDVYKIGESEADISINFFREMAKKIKQNSEADLDHPINFDIFPASGHGETKLYRRLRIWAEIEEPSLSVTE